jgi:WD40 repeat protein
LLVADFRSVRFWDAVSGAYLNQIPTEVPMVMDATFSPDGIMVTLGGCLEQTANGDCSRGVVEIWDVTTMTLLQTIETDMDRVFDVAFSPDGFYVAGAVGASVDIWGVGTGLKATTVTGFEGMVWNIAFSPAFHMDGYTLASLDTGNRVLLWDVDLPTAATTSNG